MRFRALALTALLAIAACSTTAPAAAPPPPPPTPTGPSPELKAWVDKVCGTTVTAVAPLQTQPTLDQNNASKMKTQFLDYMTKSSQSLGEGLTNLQGLTSGPSKDSARYVESHTQMLTTLKDSLDKSIAKVKDANPKDGLSFTLALQGAAGDIQSSSILASSSIGVLVEKALADAEKQAPNCQSLIKK
ncbi:hypothetical protein GCM10029964_074150 [Kibdelosporangium lantanae]